ncbi:MAG: cytochrome c peroxidase [Nitrosomonas sp.]|nr:cytochrome c peroxidase [Nitrosomonas sp.]
MKFKNKPLSAAIISGLFGAAVAGLPASLIAAPCMPCAPRAGKHNPCNPCAAKNPCAARNPCAAGGRIDPRLITRPEGTRPYQGDRLALLTEGKALWNNKKISDSRSVSCATCHKSGTTMLQPSFAKPYPHFVQMAADVAGMESITLEEMVQLCMVKPMQTKPFSWDSRQLAALTAYTAVLQQTFEPVDNAANPCAAVNPAVNPCASRNPCAVKR